MLHVTNFTLCACFTFPTSEETFPCLLSVCEVFLVCMASSKCGDVSRSSVATRRPIDLLRAHWVELEDRVWADHITGKLFEKEIISVRDKDKIESKARSSRRKGAIFLLEIMMTSSGCACLEFAVILSETERLKDLGEKLLRDAGGWRDVSRDVQVWRLILVCLSLI